MNKRLYLIAMGFAASIGSHTVQGCAVDGYIGSICWTAASFCPRGYVSARGASIAIYDAPAYYALTGDTYGGDNQTYVKVPDLTHRESIHNGQRPGSMYNYTWGMYLGFESKIIPFAPEHSHSILLNASGTGNIAISSIDGPEKDAVGNTWSLVPAGLSMFGFSSDGYSASNSVAAHLDGGSISTSVFPPLSAPSQESVPTVGPQTKLTACVNVDGLFPPRN
ncbi:Uncharacterised protein [BD1-7 clade bacterium]|uniref:Phage tail collar domain-containing protein n=1 Tax=BD1-7 clade bacterium TaxID=2029982 RepID=A0A5S9PHC1_9GAMM|nr:Uncharacterised protein [BD1-7 clade bacterium]CAA0103181.1 Uncharacterised protein [BD1-7 clade bacterium]